MHVEKSKLETLSYVLGQTPEKNEHSFNQQRSNVANNVSSDVNTVSEQH